MIECQRKPDEKIIAVKRNQPEDLFYTKSSGWFPNFLTGTNESVREGS